MCLHCAMCADVVPRRGTDAPAQFDGLRCPRFAAAVTQRTSHVLARPYMQGNNMRISVNEAALGAEAEWLNLDNISQHELADLWRSGAAVAAQRSVRSKDNKSGFGVADAVMVRINLGRLSLGSALQAGFTQQYGSVAAYRQDELGGELLLAFELPDPITDAKMFVRIMAGLETVYAGATHHASALERYDLTTPTEVQVLGRKLDSAAVKFLDRMGLETKEQRHGRGAYIRSQHTVDRMTLIALPGGDEVILEQLAPRTSVYCPVHVDSVPRAFVHWYLDGTPGVQCDCCKRTYAAPKTQRNYDFGHFDRVVSQLAAKQESIIVSGIELSSRDVVTYKQPYLPPFALVESAMTMRPWEAAKERVWLKGVIPEIKMRLALNDGVTFVKSPKGTNKTGVLEAFVAECKRQHQGVLMIGHRRSLLQSVADRLKLDCYFVVDEGSSGVQQCHISKFDQHFEVDGALQFPNDAEGGGTMADLTSATYQFVEPTRHYAVCLDSLVELDPADRGRQYEVIVIDEAEQVFAHLVGDTIKDRRREVFAKLAYYMRKARQVVLLDADLNMVAMDTVLEIFAKEPATPVRFIVNQPDLKPGVINMYGNRGHLAQVLVDRIRQGKKIFISTNSKKKAFELEKLVLVNAPLARVAVVTADNTQTTAVQNLLKNIVHKLEHELEVLIASPAIGTGIDITFKDAAGDSQSVVDYVFGFFEGNIVTHFDIDQQLLRVRHPKEVHVWIDGRPMNYETDVDCIKHELQKSVQKTAYLLRYEDDGQPVFADDGGLVNIWARVLASSRGSKNQLAKLFTDLRQQDGWRVVDVLHDAEAAASGKTELASAKESRLLEREQRLLAAEPISPDEAKELQSRDDRGLALTDAERSALERHKIEDFYGGDDISPALIAFDAEGRTRQSVKRLECLTSNLTWFANSDVDELNKNVLAFDRRRNLVQRDILESAFEAAGIFNVETREFNTDVMVAASDLDSFLAVVESKGSEIEAMFGTPLYSDRTRMPVHQLKGLLALVGLEMVLVETVQKEGKKTRRYAIVADRLADMQGAVAKRDVRFKRDEAQPREVWGSQKDKPGSTLSKEIQAHVAKSRAKRSATGTARAMALAE